MDEVRERQTIIEDVPPRKSQVVESDYEQVVHERRGLSGGAVAAIVLGIVIVGIIITMLIVNSQQQNHDDALAQAQQQAAEAQKSAADAQRSASQAAQQQQQPNVVVVPQPQPVPVPVPTPAPSTSSSSSAPAKPSNLDIEVNVNSKLLDDKELSTYPITVKLDNGVATLSGEVPSEDLKTRAERLTKTVKGVGSVINNITVRAS
jgi:type II secretory pathway pseudopilin PulG